tara:strand:- start:277 stop:1059 length:783 start_codon:yes stop_codon:yes gene_type:complete
MRKKIRIILKYLQHFFISKNIHAIHGPFIYNFLNSILREHSENCENIEELRKDLLIDNRIINILDFGAGSNINKNPQRSIKDIAKNSAKNKKCGKILYNITKYFQPKNMLELGTSLGISSIYIAQGNSNGKLYTFEGCPETAEIAKENFLKTNTNNIEIIVGDFNKTLSHELKKIKQLDFIFIDGNHQKEATISYFKKCLNYSNDKSIIVFDDIYWSKGMEDAWDYIKQHNRTTVTIDFFFLGVVFINNELSKEHFKIRI